MYSLLMPHLMMLHDEERNRAFAAAIRAVVKPGDIVVDIGSGTGLLAMWCAQAGAQKVYAVERAEILSLGHQLARDNGLADRIEFIRGDSREVQLPEPADVLVTEMFGHMGIEEQCCEIIRDAQARLLKPNARIIPQSLELQLFPAYLCKGPYADLWRPILAEGLRYELFSEMNFHTLHFPSWHDLQDAGEMQTAAAFDFASTRTLYPAETTLQWTFQSPRHVNGIAGRIHSALAPGVELTSALRTHWAPFFFACPVKFQAQPGDQLRFSWALESSQRCGWRFEFLRGSKMLHQSSHHNSLGDPRQLTHSNRDMQA